MIRSVGVIGVGEMGAPVARRLARAGFALTLCDRDRQRLEGLAGSGACLAIAPQDCAGCDAVLVFVSTEEQLLDVATGKTGLAGALGSGARPLLLVASTVSASAMRNLSAQVPARVLDVLVSGGPARAEAGQLTVLAGGREEDLRAARPILDAFADNIFLCGPVGAGQTAKIVNNVLCAANILLMAEGLFLARRQGLDLNQLTGALEVSTGRNFLTAAPSVAQVMAGYTTNRETYDAILSILVKDTALGAAMAAAQDGDFPVTQALAGTVAGLGEETWRNWAELGLAARKT